MQKNDANVDTYVYYVDSAGRRKGRRRGRVVGERELISCSMMNIYDTGSNLVTNSFFESAISFYLSVIRFSRGKHQFI